MCIRPNLGYPLEAGSSGLTDGLATGVRERKDSRLTPWVMLFPILGRLGGGGAGNQLVEFGCITHIGSPLGRGTWVVQSG